MGLTPKKSLTTVPLNIEKTTALLEPPNPFNQDKLMCKLYKLMTAQRNVLLIGTHGIGKTRITYQLAEWADLRLKTMNAATLDPYADLAGIPVVDVEKKLVQFIHDNDLDKYDIFFIDEINRPSHSKVLNGLLELIQFKTVQGRPFKKLKMCWAAMNPPGMNYNVDDIDPAMMDRFHYYVDLPSVYSVAFFAEKFGKQMGDILIQWATELSDDKRRIVTPRRLEYIGESIIMFNNDSEIVSSTVMNGTLTLNDFKILTMRLAPLFGLSDNTNTRAAARIKGLVQSQNDMNQDALARAIAQASENGV
jgi:MoxR-like ATPase